MQMSRRSVATHERIDAKPGNETYTAVGIHSNAHTHSTLAHAHLTPPTAPTHTAHTYTHKLPEHS